MRISDWSSDVCSSDLHLGISIRRFHGRDHVAEVHFGGQTRDIVLAIRLVNHLAQIAQAQLFVAAMFLARSEERRVGKECVSKCRYRWSPYHEKKNYSKYNNNSIITDKINSKNN